MTITRFIVGGFKSLRDPVEIPLAPVTLMFGPNSAGKSAVKEAWLELKRLLDTEQVNADPSLFLVRRYLTYYKKSRDAFRQRGAAGDELSEDDPFYRVVLGCHIEDLDTDVATNPYLNSISADLGFQLYKSLHGEDLRYILANSSGDICAHFALQVGGETAVEYSDYTVAVESGQIDLDELQDPRADHNERPSVFGLLRADFAVAPLNSPSIDGLKTRLFRLAAQHTNPWLSHAVRVEGSKLSLRVDLLARRLATWEASLVDSYGAGANVDPEVLASFSVIGELVELLNNLLQQLEAAIARDMEVGFVAGDRQRLKSHDLVTVWPAASMAVMPGGALETMQKYALFLGGKASGKWAEIFPGKLWALPQDDLVNDVMRGGLFAPRNYRVQADFSVSTAEVLASRNPDSVGDLTVDYRAALYLVDEQERVLDFDQVGSGVSYAFPVLTALWGWPRSWIEQPELHLHPAAQCEMGDAIVRAFNRGRFTVIETHSEHLLLRILRRVRQTSAGKTTDRELQCQPEAVAVLYFAPQQDGSTQVHHLRVTRGGDFMDRWPDGFFEERFRELFDE